MGLEAFVQWSFTHYLRIAHPAYARELAASPLRATSRPAAMRPAA
jgi:hypothetical protein